MSNGVIDYNKLVETESYHKLREVIQNEVNYFVHPKTIGSGRHSTTYAPFTIAEPARVYQTDYSVFKKLPIEKEKLLQLKEDWKKEKRKKFGESWSPKKATKEQFLELHVKI